MTIPEDIVRKLNELLIEEVAGALGITVTKHKARCFMHDDHKPSLTFNNKKNMFFCFVCNKGGGPIRLVQEHEGWAFKEACIWLANRFNICWLENDEQKKPVRRKVKRIYLPKKEDVIGEFDGELYTWLIENAKLSEQAKRFLFEERRFKEEVIERLNIKSVSLPKKAITMLIARFGEERCLKSGLLKKGQYGLYFYFYTPCLLFHYYEKDGRLMGVQSRRNRGCSSVSVSVITKDKALQSAYFEYPETRRQAFYQRGYHGLYGFVIIRAECCGDT